MYGNASYLIYHSANSLFVWHGRAAADVGWEGRRPAEEGGEMLVL